MDTNDAKSVIAWHLRCILLRDQRTWDGVSLGGIHRQSRKEAKKARRAAQRAAAGGTDGSNRPQLSGEVKNEEVPKNKAIWASKFGATGDTIVHGELISGSWIL